MKAILLVGLVMASGVYGQDKPKPEEKPKIELKADIRAELLSEQVNLWRLNSQIRALQDQVKSLQESFSTSQTKYMADVKAGLTKTGLDETKYQINPDTLEITPIAPAQAKVEEKKKP